MENIILIGMPGAGKSTLGVVLAKVMGYKFVDTDLMIQEKEGKLLCEIIREKGTCGFKAIEEAVNASVKADHTVIATGGSVVYGDGAMEHLKSIGTVIYTKLPLETIEKRVGDLTGKRGIPLDKGQTLRDIYEERCPLYEKYAHITVETDGMELSRSMKLIKKAFERSIGEA